MFTRVVQIDSKVSKQGIDQTLEWGFGKIHLKGNMWGGGNL